MQIERSGELIVISAPSGTGKSTLISRLIKTVDKLTYSVSYTTRKPRSGEQSGINYFFVSVDEFEQMRQRGEFIEHAIVHGNFYGTNHKDIQRELDNGYDVILDIDVQGAANITCTRPSTISIFIMPPGYNVLEQRLRTRGLDNEQSIEKRLSGASQEVSLFKKFNYVVINDDLEEATQSLISIIQAERYRWQRHKQLLENIVSTFEVTKK